MEFHSFRALAGAQARHVERTGATGNEPEFWMPAGSQPREERPFAHVDPRNKPWAAVGAQGVRHELDAARKASRELALEMDEFLEELRTASVTFVAQRKAQTSRLGK